MYKIEFIKGEKFARINGHLATNDWVENEVGTDEENISIEEDYISTDYCLYLKRPFKLETILKATACFRSAPKEYDNVLSKDLGLGQHWTEQEILGIAGAWIVQNHDWVKDFVIKDYSDFATDYPKFNEKKYKELQKALNDYYDNPQ